MANVSRKRDLIKPVPFLRSIYVASAGIDISDCLFIPPPSLSFGQCKNRCSPRRIFAERHPGSYQQGLCSEASKV